VPKVCYPGTQTMEMQMNEKKVSTVITIDDHPLFRKGVADLIALSESLTLVGEAASGEDGLALAHRLNPDLILLDVNMKGMDGIETLKAIKNTDIDSRVIILTVSDNEEHVVAALRAGADGYLLKDMEPEDAAPRDPDKAGLTEREEQILNLIAKGLSNKLIARELEITEGTVKVHVKHLLKKLNLHSRLEAAVWVVDRKKLRR